MLPVIKVDHLSKHYKEIKAVDDISFTVNQGDVYGFLGQNGAGKSTTIRMLLSLVEPTEGSIEIFGLNLASNHHRILKKVGAVIERPDLYKYLTAVENLSLFAKMSGVKADKKKLLEQLEMVGLQDRAFSKVRTYSQGMKQRLGIAVALVHDPELIILDEPTNGLDPQGIADMRNLILDLSRHHGKTIVVSSHLLHEIEMIANRMLIIDKGKKITEGAVEDLFDPANVIVELEVNNPEHTLFQIKGGLWKDNLQEHQKNVFILKLDKKLIPSMTADLVSKGVEILSLHPRHSLEAYFLALTSANRHVDTFTN